jgi:hypothetical protein
MGLNIETFIHVLVIIIGGIGLMLFLKLDWKSYGLLFVFSGIVGNVCCYIFVKLGFYSYPYLFFPEISIMPSVTITLTFPILVLLAVRYSPEKWEWKIPFYWAIIHIGIFGETWALNNTRLIEYNYKWDFWDSYTWWWIFFLVFEWIGSLIIPNGLRKPINVDYLKYGKLGWAIIHFVLIATIFLAGYYLGSLKAE